MKFNIGNVPFFSIAIIGALLFIQTIRIHSNILADKNRISDLSDKITMQVHLLEGFSEKLQEISNQLRKNSERDFESDSTIQKTIEETSEMLVRQMANLNTESSNDELQQISEIIQGQQGQILTIMLNQDRKIEDIHNEITSAFLSESIKGRLSKLDKKITDIEFKINSLSSEISALRFTTRAGQF